MPLLPGLASPLAWAATGPEPADRKPIVQTTIRAVAAVMVCFTMLSNLICGTCYGRYGERYGACEILFCYVNLAGLAAAKNAATSFMNQAFRRYERRVGLSVSRLSVCDLRQATISRLIDLIGSLIYFFADGRPVVGSFWALGIPFSPEGRGLAIPAQVESLSHRPLLLALRGKRWVNETA